MYPKNSSNPPAIAIGAIYSTVDGSLVTAGASVRVKTGTGSWGAGGGTLSCDSTSGTWEYTPLQAETNAASFMVAVYKTACTQATITVVTTASDTPGYGGVDWGLVRQPSTAVSLSATTISTSQQVASVSGNVGGSVGSVTGSVGSISGVTFPTNFGSLGINSSGHVSRVVLCDTTTTNTDMRGTDNAALAIDWTATRAGYLDSVLIAANSNRTVLVTGSNHVAAVVHDAEPDSIPEDAFVSGALSARVIATDAITAAKVAADVGTEIGVAVWASSTRELTSGANIVLAKGTGITGLNDITAASVWSVGTRELTSGANIVLAKGIGLTGLNDLSQADIRTATGLSAANLDSQLTAIKSDTAAILDDTGTSGVVVASGSKSGYSLSSSGLDVVLIDGVALPKAVQIMAASVAGKVSGAGTASEVFKGLDGITTRMTVTADESGNRSNVVYVTT